MILNNAPENGRSCLLTGDFVTWCDSQFVAFNEALKLDAVRAARISRAVVAPADRTPMATATSFALSAT